MQGGCDQGKAALACGVWRARSGRAGRGCRRRESRRRRAGRSRRCGKRRLAVWVAGFGVDIRMPDGEQRQGAKQDVAEQLPVGSPRARAARQGRWDRTCHDEEEGGEDEIDDVMPLPSRPSFVMLRQAGMFSTLRSR